MASGLHPEKRSFGSVFLFRPALLKLMGWGLLSLCWLLPNHYPPWLNFHSETLALAAVALLALAWLVPAAQSRWPVLACSVAALAILPWLQWTAGVNAFAGDALMSSYYLVAWALAIAIGYQLTRVDDASGVAALMHALWPAALLSAAVGLVQWLKLEPSLGIFATQTDPGDRAMGNLAQPNQLATFLLVGLLAYSHAFERRTFGWLAYALGVGLMTAVLVMTQSRAGMLGALAVACFLVWKRSRMASRLRLSHVVAWVVLFFGATVLFPRIDAAVAFATPRASLTTVNDRVVIWQQVADGISQAPWLGYGWNQTVTATMAGAAAHPARTPATYAHNVLLDLLAWNGVPLGVLLIGLAGYWFCTRLWRVTNLSGGYAMACLLPIVVHSLVEYPFAYAYFLLTAGLMMGVVEASLALHHGWRVRRLAFGLALAAWSVVGVAICREYLLVEEDLRVTRFENLRVGATETSYRMPRIHLLTQMAAMESAVRYQPVAHTDAQRLEALRQVAWRFPTGSLTLNYAMALALNGDPAGARHMMATLRGLYGERYYLAASDMWRDKATQHPELRALSFP